jgi:ribosomal protein S18 acetylase RimI-like enzyme
VALLVLLTPLTLAERGAFSSALAADYVDFLASRGEAADPVAALAQARAGIEAEVEAAVQAGEELWAAWDAGGGTVGWLWVKYSVAGLPPSAAFLYQILVKPEFRRQGYGSAMLAALEHLLVAAGRSELRLNVWEANEAARRLYERAGYVLVERFPAKRQLHKRLPPADPIRTHAG